MAPLRFGEGHMLLNISRYLAIRHSSVHQRFMNHPLASYQYHTGSRNYGKSTWSGEYPALFVEQVIAAWSENLSAATFHSLAARVDIYHRLFAAPEQSRRQKWACRLETFGFHSRMRGIGSTTCSFPSLFFCWGIRKVCGEEIHC